MSRFQPRPEDAGKTAPAARLAAWYRESQRDLPWRQTADPYKIWISETMLQQTRVETVIPYYYSFLERYPTVTDLAQADEADVMKLWQGLGYYSRARNLHRAAKQVVSDHGGIIPDNVEQFQALTGVGPYTAGAVQSIAFNQPVPAVDGNVLRVMARYMAIGDEVRSRSATVAITERVREWLHEESPRLLTQAIMELGALVCTPRNPKCGVCPLQADCEAFARGLTTELPVRKKPAARQIVQVMALWCEQNGKVLLEQRPSTGLLSGMWQLPAIEIKEGKTETELGGASGGGAQEIYTHALDKSLPGEGQRQRPEQDFHGSARDKLLQLYSRGDELTSWSDTAAEPGALEFREVAETKHIFTHIEWKVKVLQPVGWDLSSIPEGKHLVWADEKALARLALPRVYDKLVTAYFQGN